MSVVRPREAVVTLLNVPGDSLYSISAWVLVISFLAESRVEAAEVERSIDRHSDGGKCTERKVFGEMQEGKCNMNVEK